MQRMNFAAGGGDRLGQDDLDRFAVTPNAPGQRSAVEGADFIQKALANFFEGRRAHAGTNPKLHAGLAGAVALQQLIIAGRSAQPRGQNVLE